MQDDIRSALLKVKGKAAIADHQQGFGADGAPSRLLEPISKKFLGPISALGVRLSPRNTNVFLRVKTRVRLDLEPKS
jgi:hypothetical protein